MFVSHFDLDHAARMQVHQQLSESGTCMCIIVYVLSILREIWLYVLDGC